MKNFLKLILISPILFASLVKAQMFIGIDMGYDKGALTDKSGAASAAYGINVDPNRETHAFVMGGSVGFEHIFNRFIGTRTFITTLFGSPTSNNGLAYQVFTAEFNTDYVTRFIEMDNLAFGAFFGTGFGSYVLNKRSQRFSEIPSMSVQFYLRLGITTKIKDRHIFDLTTQLPIAGYRFSQESWDVHYTDTGFHK